MARIQRYLLYGVIFVAGFISISLWNFYSILHPPQIEAQLSPALFDFQADDVEIHTDDKISLSGWFIEPQTSPERALIILHGYPAEKSDMLFIAESLYPDFSLLLLDLRSFGESEGAYTTLGFKEREDIRHAIDFLEKRGYTRIGIFGFSFGGALALLSAAEEDRIHAVASYASFSDLKTLGYYSYRRLWIFKKPMVDLMALWARIAFGKSTAEISPVKASEKLAIPVFIAHSREDEQIPFSHALHLQNALRYNKKAEYYFFDGKVHGDLPKEFYIALKDFFIKAL